MNDAPVIVLQTRQTLYAISPNSRPREESPSLFLLLVIKSWRVFLPLTIALLSSRCDLFISSHFPG